jgi:endonuclease/exonuclease/phosphatase family metal-dependent hydrolase
MILPRALVLALALAFAVAPPASAQPDDERPRAPIDIDVMTFNIRTSEIDDGDNAWELRREMVAQMIGRANPHVLGMQEAMGEQIAYLEHMLPQYRWIGVDRGLNGGTGLSEATPIFYRYDVLVPIESGTFWLGNAPSAPFQGREGGRGGSRIVTWARFHHIETAEQIWVFNTHFSPREGQQHLDAVARINERLASIPAGDAVVVLGDFNASAGWSDTWRAATSGGLRDAWVLAAEQRGPAQTYGGFRAPDGEGMGRIDWILVGASVDVSLVETVLHNAAGRYPSDHFPVLATLRVRPD